VELFGGLGRHCAGLGTSEECKELMYGRRQEIHLETTSFWLNGR
jgi:hypothetical protein